MGEYYSLKIQHACADNSEINGVCKWKREVQEKTSLDTAALKESESNCMRNTWLPSLTTSASVSLSTGLILIRLERRGRCRASRDRLSRLLEVTFLDHLVEDLDIRILLIDYIGDEVNALDDLDVLALEAAVLWVALLVGHGLLSQEDFHALQKSGL